MKLSKPVAAVAAFGLALGMMATGNAQADTFGSGANAFTIDFVDVGNAGNANDAGAGGGVAGTAGRYDAGRARAKPALTSDELGQRNCPPRWPSLRLSARSLGYARAARRLMPCQRRQQQQRDDIGDLDHRIDGGAGGVLVRITDGIAGDGRLVRG